MALAPVVAPSEPQGDDSARDGQGWTPSRLRLRAQRTGQSLRRRIHWSMPLVIAVIATFVSIIDYAYWSSRGMVLEYADAISHMLMARHVWDSSTPGLAQLGSAWLPLDHILMLPFVWFEPLYRSGLAGALPSMLAYVVGCAAMAALARTLFHSNWAGVLAAVTYGSNPNLLYLQATPMSESSMLAAATLSAYFLARWIQTASRDGRRFSWQWHARIGAEDLDPAIATASNRIPARHGSIARHPTSPHMSQGTVLSGLPEVAPLILLALSVCAASLVRYDGWSIALAAGLAVAAVSFLLWGPQAARARLLVFGALGFAGCIGWLLYNWIIFGDPLDFYRGVYSPTYQEDHIASQSGLPTKGNLLLSLHIYTQTVVDNAGILVMIGAGLGIITAFTLLVATPLIRKMRSSQHPSPSARPAAPQHTWPMTNGLAWVTVLAVLSTPFFFNLSALYSGTTILSTPEVTTRLGTTYSNVRYGLIALPLLALGVAGLAALVPLIRRYAERANLVQHQSLATYGPALHKLLVSGTIAIMLIVGYVGTVGAMPYVLQDAAKNRNANGQLPPQVDAAWLAAHYHGGYILASTGAYGAMTFDTGLPDDDFLNESTKPNFNYALVDPQAWATWIVVSSGGAVYDPVWDHLVASGETWWQADYTQVYQNNGTHIYERNP